MMSSADFVLRKNGVIVYSDVTTCAQITNISGDKNLKNHLAPLLAMNYEFIEERVGKLFKTFLTHHL